MPRYAPCSSVIFGGFYFFGGDCGGTIAVAQLRYGCGKETSINKLKMQVELRLSAFARNYLLTASFCFCFLLGEREPGSSEAALPVLVH